MGNGVFTNGNFDKRLASRVGGLANGFGNFICLAESTADLASLVASNNEGAEAEATAAFDDFGATINEDNLLAELGSLGAVSVLIGGFAWGIATISATTAVLRFCHNIKIPILLRERHPQAL